MAATNDFASKVIIVLLGLQLVAWALLIPAFSGLKEDVSDMSERLARLEERSISTTDYAALLSRIVTLEVRMDMAKVSPTGVTK